MSPPLLSNVIITMMDLTCGHVAILAVSVMFLLVASQRRRRDHFPMAPGKLPLIGHALALADSDKFYSVIQEWIAGVGQQEGIYEFNLLGKRWIVLCSTESVMACLKLRPFKMIRAKILSRSIDSLNGDGIFSSNGDQWRRERRIVGPALNQNHVRDFFPSIQLVAKRLVQKWTKAAAQKVDIPAANLDMTAFALDIVALSILGLDINTIHHPENQLAKDVEELFRITFLRTLVPIPYWKIPIIGPYLDGFREGNQRIVATLMSKVQEYRKRKANDDTSIDNAKNQTFVEKIIDISEGEKVKLNDEQIVGNLLTVFVAATDTASNTVSFSLWELANDLALQDELYQEVIEYTNGSGKRSLDDLTMEDALECFPRLRSFLFEMLRLKGPGPLLFFEPVESMEFLGKTVEPGDVLVTVGPSYPHNKKTTKSEVPFGPNGEPPQEFCARRWLTTEPQEEKKEDVSPTCIIGFRPKLIVPSNREAGFLAFGHGLRVCPGKMYAHVEMVTVMVHLLHNFRITPAKDCPKMTVVSRFTETFAEDLKLTLTSRGN
ncbi:unnamed protein product [Cylindrotheca closterium]|uniref:Cytochrome P450 n=1 Tax=Cylindrotheca closterium TaxID=2856 RepID=A0AAD2JPD1_9STRA|nr:unnamed protein product [Cylindrotheca closterium]